MNKVVKGDDIYRKTTPQEWQSFERVIKENGPFDIVMDGLNVAYSNNSDLYRPETARLHIQKNSKPSVDRVI